MRHNSMAFSELAPLHASAEGSIVAGIYSTETTRIPQSFMQPHFCVPLATDQKSEKRNCVLLDGHFRSLPTELFYFVLFCSTLL